MFDIATGNGLAKAVGKSKNNTLLEILVGRLAKTKQHSKENKQGQKVPM